MDARMISLVRFGLLGTMAAFSLIVLGLAGNFISSVNGVIGLFVPDYLGLDLAVAVITMVVIAVSLSVDFFRKGAFTSMVAVEIGWTFLLTVLWIAAAGDTTALLAGISCNFTVTDFNGDVLSSDNPFVAGCHEAQALIAFAWLNFFMMLGWHSTLIIITIIAHTRGQTSVWTGPVSGTDFFKVVAVQPRGEMAYGGVQPQYTGAPVQQEQYTGSQPQQTYPPTGYAGPSPGAAIV